MEDTGWLWGKLILENSKALGNKIISGVKDASFYVAEKSKEGVSYIAEKTKPATDKIKEGAGYIGSQIKYTYENLKMKISKGKNENNNDTNGKNMEMDNDAIEENGDTILYKSLIGAESSNYSEIKN